MRRKHNLRKKNLALVVSAVSTMLAGGVSTSAIAQDDTLEEIVVTGSRIVRRDLDAPSPIVTIGSESFENSSSNNIENVLNQMPQFVPAGTQFGNGGIQNTPTSTPGAATLNLRGLGTNRNLVLIDGRRAQPANASLVVDINTIPASAIANVEVITGGASAVYGPDAMAGVVNFILKDNFEGVEFDFNGSTTAEDDGSQQRASMLMGLNSADGRGNIMIGVDYTTREDVLQKDRSFFVNGWLDPNNPGGQFMQPSTFGAGERLRGIGGNGPSQAAVDGLFPQAAPGTVGTTSEFRFNQDGSVFVNQGGLGYNGPINCLEGCGSFTGIKRLASGGLDQVNINGYASTPMERHSLFLRGNYDLTDNVNAYVQATYTNTNIGTRGNIPPAITVWQSPVVRDGRALPADLNTLLDSRAQPDVDWSLYRVLDFNGPIEVDHNDNVYQFVAGLKGDFMEGDWTWDAYVSRGDTRRSSDYQHMPSLQRYQFLINQNNFGQGSGFVNSGRSYSVSCPSGLPIFEDFVPDAECVDGFDTRQVDRSRLTQEIAEINLQGGLFDLPAGEVRVAIGASYRENTYGFFPGNPANSVVENPIGTFSSNGSSGEIDVSEYYAEAIVPVIEGLNLELGYRYSDFSTAGGQDTYKAMFTWDAMEGVNFRGGYQFATRAPNIAELFSAPSLEVVGFPLNDLCAVTTLAPWGNVPGNPDRAQVQQLCRDIIGNDTSGFDTQTYSITGFDGADGFHRQNPPFFPLEIEIIQGNPNVGPEEGETYTIGAVISDPFGIENLTITADYYDIEITDTISPISSSAVYNTCFNSNGSSNPTYDVTNASCQLITRNASTGDRSQVDALYSNLGILTTQGVDVTANWTTDIGPGTLGVNTAINFLDSFEYQQSPDSPLIDATGTLDQGGLFDFRAFTTFSYRWDDFSVGLTWQHLSDIDSEASASQPTTTIQGAGAYDMFNLNASYNWENYSLRVGIDNLFDEDPETINNNPGIDSNSNSTNAGFYDTLGTRYYIGLKASF